MPSLIRTSHADMPKAGGVELDAHQRFWRSIAEADGGGDDAEAAVPVGVPVTRRDFLAWMGASLALGAGGCARPPLEKIVPYREGPPEGTYGQPVYYATGLACDGTGVGVLVRCNMGRP